MTKKIQFLNLIALILLLGQDLFGYIISLGSYIGTAGTRTISVGFPPSLVILRSRPGDDGHDHCLTGNMDTAFKSNYQAGDGYTIASGSAGTGLTLVSTGFYLSNYALNTSEQPYAYIAIKCVENADVITRGSSSQGSTVTLSFAPAIVLIISPGDGVWVKTASMTGTSAVKLNASAASSGVATISGTQVIFGSTIGDPVYYYAIKDDAPRLTCDEGKYNGNGSGSRNISIPYRYGHMWCMGYHAQGLSEWYDGYMEGNCGGGAHLYGNSFIMEYNAVYVYMNDILDVTSDPYMRVSTLLNASSASYYWIGWAPMIGDEWSGQTINTTIIF